MTQPNGDNQHPVDSTYYPCCNAIGQHTQDCLEIGWLPTWPDYLPDRYDRLAGGINEIATTPAFFQPTGSTTPAMLRELGAKIAERRLLDGITDHDANCAIAYAAMTFPAGIAHMVLRLGDQMHHNGPGYQPADDHKALVSVLVQILTAAYEAVSNE